MASRQERSDRDAELARRLAEGDPRAPTDIFCEYETFLKHLFEKSKGQGLGDEDIEDLVQETFAAFFRSFRAERGGNVRGLLFKIAGAQRDRWFRRIYARRIAASRCGDDTSALPGPESAEPIARLLSRYWADDREAAALRVVHELARSKLTKRQHKALEAWMNAETGGHWAKALEGETGVSAKAWRCACDEARQRVRAELEARGLFNDAKEIAHVEGRRGSA